MSWQPPGMQPPGWQPDGWQPGEDEESGAPALASQIPDIVEAANTGPHVYVLSDAFTGATSFSIAPAIADGWSFNLVSGLLTIDTDEAADFGDFVVTATNENGDTQSNAFNILVRTGPPALVPVSRLIR